MVVIPPKVAVEEPGSLWPPIFASRWGAFWEKEDGRYRLQPTHESNLWQVVRVKADSSEEVAGYLAVYVDDLLAAGPDDVVEGCLARILKECAAPEYIREIRG